MPTEFLMLPPQTDKTREWGARLAAALPELKVVVAENHTHAAGRSIAHADAAFGTIPPDLLRQASGCDGCRRRRPPRPPAITIPN